MKRIIAILIFMLSSMSALAGTVYEFKAVGSETGHLRIEASGDIEAIGPLIKDFQKLEQGISITYVTA